MNLFDIPDEKLPGEFVELLAQGESIRIEHIVSDGQVSGWCDQEESEFVALLTGTAQLEFEDGRTAELAAGDTLLIRPHEKHRVSFTSTEPKCVWLCVFFKDVHTGDRRASTLGALCGIIPADMDLETAKDERLRRQ